MAKLSHATFLLMACLAGLSCGAAGLKIDLHFGKTSGSPGDGGRKLRLLPGQAETTTGCLTITNDCPAAAYGVALAVDNNATYETTTGWLQLLPGDSISELCVEASNTRPSLWLYAKDLTTVVSFCPPTEGDEMPTGYLDSHKFCLHGQEPHDVVRRSTRSRTTYTDEQTGATSTFCEGLGSCYGEATFYELNLPSTWDLPC